MGFALTLFYLLSSLLTPAEIMPVLLPYRIMLVLLARDRVTQRLIR